MIDRDGQKAVADRRKGKFERHTLGGFDYQPLLGLYYLSCHLAIIRAIKVLLVNRALASLY
jgi:hypothetical protein